MVGCDGPRVRRRSGLEGDQAVRVREGVAGVLAPLVVAAGGFVVLDAEAGERVTIDPALGHGVEGGFEPIDHIPQ